MNSQFDEIDKEISSSPVLLKPRVLFVLGVLWGENGITSHLLTLSKALIQQGCEVALATNLASNVKGASEEAMRAIHKFEACGIQHFSVPFAALRFAPGSLTDTFSALRSLHTIICKFQPDVIHIHSLSVAPYIKVMQLLHHFPFVSTCHLEPESSRRSVKLSRFFSQFFGDHLIAISSDLKNAFQNLMRIPEAKIQLICHGIDASYFRSPSLQEQSRARDFFGLDVDSKTVCLIGRLSQVKGHQLLIQALAILKSQGINVIALFAGKGYGDEEAIIRIQATQAGVLEQIRLLGLADSRQVLWASDVLILPSQKQTEAFPLVIPEAMLCGVVPIRTPAAGAFDQIEDGVNGFIVPFGDAETLALRLKQLLENQELRSQMSKAALEAAQEKFTVEQMTKKTIAVYEKERNLSKHSKRMS
jgi:glycosyltransferase involved in cell wall biosynthesis